MLDDTQAQIARLSEEFTSCSKLLIAMGNETRLHLILKMMTMGECSGVRVGAVAKETNLSRPAVSHHLQILKDAGLIRMRREGTKNYYFFDPEMKALLKLADALRLAADISRALPDRAAEE